MTSTGSEAARLELEAELDQLIERARVAEEQDLDDLSEQIAVLLDHVIDLGGQIGFPDLAEGWEDRLMERWVRDCTVVCPRVHDGDVMG